MDDEKITALIAAHFEGHDRLSGLKIAAFGRHSIAQPERFALCIMLGLK